MYCSGCHSTVKDSWGGLRLQCILECGYAIMYMGVLNRDVDFGAQTKRVASLIKRLEQLEQRDHAVRTSMTAAKRKGRFSTARQWRALLQDIRDEIENMC